MYIVMAVQRYERRENNTKVYILCCVHFVGKILQLTLHHWSPSLVDPRWCHPHDALLLL